MNHFERQSGPANAVMVLGLVFGSIILIVASIAGDPMLGLAMFGIMAAYVAILWLGGRFDLVQVLRGEPADERYKEMEHRSIIFAANMVALVCIGLFAYEIATNGDPGPYALVGFVFAVSMVGSLAWQRLTS